MNKIMIAALAAAAAVSLSAGPVGAVPSKTATIVTEGVNFGANFLGANVAANQLAPISIGERRPRISVPVRDPGRLCERVPYLPLCNRN